jgi:PQQ-dependent dehydrogenase (methanol/ethanol family)
MTRSAVTIGLLLTAAGGGSLAAQQAATPSVSVFTIAQADQGRRVFGAYCATCHGAELEGAVGPALAGPAFLRKWGAPERSADDLYYVLRSTMPKPAMGSLSADSYAAVFAYILQRNGLAAGSQPFAATPAQLTAIGLDQLAAAAGPAALPPPAFIAGDHGLAPRGTGPSQAEISHPDSGDWLYHTGDYAGTRYSSLAQITRDNVARMNVACAYQIGSTESFLTGPIVYQGTMYVTTPHETVAIDAATCRRRWQSTWKPRDEDLWLNNRGVAVKDGYVVRGTADGYLLALDAQDGSLLWARHVARPDSGETITMPPLIFDDLVLIGPAGSENNVQGWIGAFRLADGAPVWRFHTVPRPGEPGAETWANPSGIPVGGGAVWTPVSLDQAKGEMYVAVTNPSPDMPAAMRPGKNLYTNAIVALDVRTGKLRWYEQLVPNDAHDWDLTQVSPLFRGTVNGRERNLIATAGKHGMLTVLDRDTHQRLYEVPVTTRFNVDQPIDKKGVRVCPGFLGGVEWNGPALNRATNMLYIPAVDWCNTLTLADTVRLVPGQLYLGGTITFDSTSQGWLTAVDASNGTVRWRYRSAKPMVAAVTTTAGGLVFTGEQTGDFLALDGRTGQERYRFYTGSGIFGGVVTYAVNSRQYVATTSGGGSLTFGREGSPTIFVFALPNQR